MNKILFIFLFIIIASPAFSERIEGTILNKTTLQAIEYVNIGIPNKNTGTVSNLMGQFSIEISSEDMNDSILISCIGFENSMLSIKDIISEHSNQFYLKERTYTLNSLTVKPGKTKTVGIKSASKKFQAGFKDNYLGYECGVLMKNKGIAHLKKIEANIGICSLDTVLYRVNIYTKKGKKNFENILSQAIYYSAPASPYSKIIVNLSDYNISTQGDFLITFEYIKNQEGRMNFCSKLGKKTYYRKTSQAKWETAPIGIAISAEIEVE